MRPAVSGGKRLLLLSACIIAALGLHLASGCGGEPIVKEVDSISIHAPVAESMFALFDVTLGLPVAWPLEQYPGFITGGIQLGNVNIEIEQVGGAAPTYAGSPTSADIRGLAFEPLGLSEAEAALRERGADPGRPEVVKDEVNGESTPVWTDVPLNSLTTRYYNVYLREYTAAEAAELKSRIKSPPFGEIGIESLKEVSVLSTDVEKTKSAWEKAFAPVKMSDGGLMKFGDGPAVRISKGSSDRIEGFVMEVKSLDKAKSYLQKNNLLLMSTGSFARVDSTMTQGIEIQFVQ